MALINQDLFPRFEHIVDLEKKNLHHVIRMNEGKAMGRSTSMFATVTFPPYQAASHIRSLIESCREYIK